MNPENKLSCDALILIQRALDFRESHLEVLHWQAVALGATDPLYRNIAQEIAKIGKARSELAAVYESQFPA